MVTRAASALGSWVAKVETEFWFLMDLVLTFHIYYKSFQNRF